NLYSLLLWRCGSRRLPEAISVVLLLRTERSIPLTLPPPTVPKILNSLNPARVRISVPQKLK
ncbi:hypothetical protein AVEN_203909-1, partial [Araneus ventricosus]